MQGVKDKARKLKYASDPFFACNQARHTTSASTLTSIFYVLMPFKVSGHASCWILQLKAISSLQKWDLQ